MAYNQPLSQREQWTLSSKLTQIFPTLSDLEIVSVVVEPPEDFFYNHVTPNGEELDEDIAIEVSEDRDDYQRVSVNYVIEPPKNGYVECWTSNPNYGYFIITASRVETYVCELQDDNEYEAKYLGRYYVACDPRTGHLYSELLQEEYKWTLASKLRNSFPSLYDLEIAQTDVEPPEAFLEKHENPYHKEIDEEIALKVTEDRDEQEKVRVNHVIEEPIHGYVKCTTSNRKYSQGLIITASRVKIFMCELQDDGEYEAEYKGEHYIACHPVTGHLYSELLPEEAKEPLMFDDLEDVVTSFKSFSITPRQR